MRHKIWLERFKEEVRKQKEEEIQEEIKEKEKFDRVILIHLIEF